MQGLRARQASIDYHLETARECLALSVSRRSLLDDDPPQCDVEVVEQQHGSRIAAKITHLRNLINALTPSVPATTEVHQNSVFNLFRAGVETLWNDRREHNARDRMNSQTRLVQVHVDLPMTRRSLELSSTSTPRHRRVGSSRI